MGGLSRRAYIIDKIRKEESKPVLVLDAGAMLFPQPYIPPSTLNAKTVQAEGLIKAMAKMEYDAYGLAPQDLSTGTGFIIRQPSAYQLPWISMNLAQKENDQLLFPPFYIKSLGKLTVGILSLTGTAKPTPGLAPFIDYNFISWETVLEKSLAQVNNQVDMVILLSSLPAQTNRKIADKYSDVHLIIQSGQSTANMKPQLYNNTLLTQTGSRGKYVGRLDIQWSESGRWIDETSTRLKQLKDQVDRTSWQLGRLKKRYSPDQIEQNSQYKKLLLEKSKLSEELDNLVSRQAEQKQQFSSYKSSFIALPVALPEEPNISKIVQQTKFAVNQANKKTFAEQQEKSQVHIQAFSSLAGWQACKACHESQTDFWHETRHSKSWRTLVMVNQQFNPDCLVCHVTLPTYNQDDVLKNNLLADLQEEFKSVSCEACHGPAKNHSLEPEKHSPKKPNAETCLICHTPERDDDFIYSEKLGKIRCPASGH